jgi:4-amino-4-deoxy-L-arabinose transferase
MMTRAKRFLFIVFALVLGLYILPLGVRPMFIPDESRYAEVPREMIASGNWISPHLDGLRYFEKPVLGYWVTAGSLLLFGDNNFAVRLPSALAVALAAFFIFRLVRGRSARTEITPALAVLVFITSLEVYAVGTFCVLDSLLACLITGTLAFFYLASTATPGSRQEKKLLLLAGICCGLAFLTKGFLALVIPVLTIVPYLLIRRRFADIFRMAWLPMLTALLVALPWSILIHQREPEFWRFFFWNEHVRRFLADNAQHREPFWYFFLSAPPMFLPWIFLAPAAVTGLFSQAGPERGKNQKERLSPLVAYCLCWFFLPFFFFSAASGKLLTYILPCFPPFAILTAMGLQQLLQKGESRVFQLGARGAALSCGILAAAIISLLIAARLFDLPDYLPDQRLWKWLMAANGLIVMTFFFSLAARAATGGRKILLFGLAPVLLLFLANFIMPDQTLEKKAPALLLQRHQQDVTAESLVFSGEETLQNVCWYFKRENVYLIQSAGELDFGVKHGDAGSRLLDLDQVHRLIDNNPGKSILIASVKKYESWKYLLPEPRLLDNNGAKGYVFAQY